jgi:hypothetical protein
MFALFWGSVRALYTECGNTDCRPEVHAVDTMVTHCAQCGRDSLTMDPVHSAALAESPAVSDATILWQALTSSEHYSLGFVYIYHNLIIQKNLPHFNRIFTSV